MVLKKLIVVVILATLTVVYATKNNDDDKEVGKNEEKQDCIEVSEEAFGLLKLLLTSGSDPDKLLKALSNSRNQEQLKKHHDSLKMVFESLQGNE